MDYGMNTLFTSCTNSPWHLRYNNFDYLLQVNRTNMEGAPGGAMKGSPLNYFGLYNTSSSDISTATNKETPLHIKGPL
jgi:hypothetical protein